jgi:thiol:disulfide interchange protein DsbD
MTYNKLSNTWERLVKRFLLSLLLLSFSAFAQAENDLLPADEAFAFKAKVVNDEVLLTWDIAQGYYLYKEKIKISSDFSTQLGIAKFPKAKIKNDEFFGKIGVYRNNAVVAIPVLEGDARSILLTVTYQGCADLGVCYPPQKITLPIQLAQADTGTKKGAFGILSDLTSGIGGDEPELLDPDKAFAFSAELEGPGTLVAEWIVAEGYYLYKDKIKMVVALKN